MNTNRSVILIHPQIISGFQAQPWCDLPLGLLYVAEPLVRAGYRVCVIDQRTTKNWRELLLSELAGNPICIGITSMTGPQLYHALEVSKIIKQYGDIPVVWGGVHASLLPEQTLENENIDFVVEGEGEETLLELVRAIEHQDSLTEIAGLWYKDKGIIKFTGQRPFINLNLHPVPEFDLVDLSKYTRTVFGVQRISLSTSRGCCFPCAFCYNTIFHRRQWRALDADIAVRQIKEFVQRYSFKGLFLTDANFFVDIDRARAILEGVVREGLDLVFSRIHIRFDTISKLSLEDFTLMEKAGVKCLAIGIESGSERIRHLLRKPIDIPTLLEFNRIIRRFSIMPLYFFMMGYPTETVNDLRETVSLFTALVKENPNASKSLNIYSPYPGTELYDLAVAEGLTPPHKIEDWFSFSYRSLSGGGPWLSKRMKRIIEMLDFCAFFVGETSYLNPFKQTNPLVVLLANIYAPIARKRVGKFFYKLPIEIKLAKALGLFAKQS